ncbi:MAG TPA: DUF1697 domain-containing protein [Gemmatimonadales bacterium]
MTVHIALLRAINVGGRKLVAMADLRDFLSQLGFHEPRSLLQSGNLVFRSDARSSAAIERTLEAEAVKRLGLETDFFVRSAAEWAAIVAGNPFPEEARRDPARLLVMCLKHAPAAGDVRALGEAIRGRETVRADGRTAYIVYPDGVGRSRLTAALLEKKLGTRSTGRNWNTVLKLAGAAHA